MVARIDVVSYDVLSTAECFSDRPMTSAGMRVLGP